MKRVALILSVGLLFACSGSDSAPGSSSSAPSNSARAPGFTLDPVIAANLPQGLSVEQVDAGRRLYSSLGRCQACHGFAGRGSRQGPPLDGKSQWIHGDGSPESLAQIIKEGVAKPKRYVMPMPPMGGGTLNDEQIQSIAAYVWTLHVDKDQLEAEPTQNGENGELETGGAQEGDEAQDETGVEIQDEEQGSQAQD